MGASMKLNQLRIDEILKGVSDGLTKDAASQLAGISRVTFYKWLRQGEVDAGAGRNTLKRQLFERIPMAEIACEAWHLSNIRMGAERDWKASGWYLERTRHERYGRRFVAPPALEASDELTVIG